MAEQECLACTRSPLSFSAIQFLFYFSRNILNSEWLGGTNLHYPSSNLEDKSEFNSFPIVDMQLSRVGAGPCQG